MLISLSTVNSCYIKIIIKVSTNFAVCKSAGTLVSPDKQMFCAIKSPHLDFLWHRLFDLKGLGAGAGRSKALDFVIHMVAFYYS